jgi:hypothetical protein
MTDPYFLLSVVSPYDPVYCGKFGEANVLFLMAWDATNVTFAYS